MSAASTSRLAARYLAALRAHLSHGEDSSLATANALGKQALKQGLDTLDLARIHELALVALLPPEHPPNDGDVSILRSGAFLRQALTPSATATSATPQGPQPATTPPAERPGHRAEVATLKQHLQRETDRRKEAEQALKTSHQHYEQLLAQSHLMQAQLRHLSHQILLAQEEERKQISRELHDEISQILTGINVRLAALKIEATANTGNLKKKIASTQRLVEKSVAAVHHFARELRPAMLDDLGLVPTLLTFMKDLRKRTGLQIRYTASTPDQVEQLDNLKRTVLYRIAQEALTNVTKHAVATMVAVSIKTEADGIAMAVSDNGRSFDASGAFTARGGKRLGILGMRERAEMVGGTFAIESVAGTGTTVHVRIPFHSSVAADRTAARGSRKRGAQ
jgi:signal transduction histidine kinase